MPALGSIEARLLFRPAAGFPDETTREVRSQRHAIVAIQFIAVDLQLEGTVRRWRKHLVSQHLDRSHSLFALRGRRLVRLEVYRSDDSRQQDCGGTNGSDCHHTVVSRYGHVFLVIRLATSWSAV